MGKLAGWSYQGYQALDLGSYKSHNWTFVDGSLLQCGKADTAEGTFYGFQHTNDYGEVFYTSKNYSSMEQARKAAVKYMRRFPTEKQILSELE